MRIPSIVVGVLLLARVAAAQEDTTPEVRVTLDDALRAARAQAPDLLVARSKEQAADAEVTVARTYPNPSLLGGTSSQTAKLSAGVSIPLVILGQREVAMDAARAEGRTVRLESQATWIDVRWATTRAFAELWLAEGAEKARRNAADLAAKLDDSVAARVQVGSGAEIDSLRTHAEKLQIDADALEAGTRVLVASGELARYIGSPPGSGQLRAKDEPPVPDSPPPLATLLAQIDSSVHVRHEQSDAAAARARASRERALVRPQMVVDLGMDAFDPTLPDPSTPNFRAQLAIEIPIFNHRGGYVDREIALEGVARSRESVVRAQVSTELATAYRTYLAATERWKLMTTSVVPAAEATVKAMQDAYSFGRSPLIALLDAQRALVAAHISALEARALRSQAWADVDRALGSP